MVARPVGEWVKVGELQHRYEAMHGFAAIGEVEKVLAGLGFEPADFDRSCRTFSGRSL